MRMLVVMHAVERYQDRWVPHLTFREARRELVALFHGARPTRRKTRTGEELWTVSAPVKILLVVKRDPDGTCVCVTVLPEGANEGNAGLRAEEYLEYQEDRAIENLRILRLCDRLCQKCESERAVRYNPRVKQKWCDICYQAAKKAAPQKLGWVPLIEEWEKFERTTRVAQVMEEAK
jgi:hypothetical protein